MDDCNLKKLQVKPGELSPAFRPDVLVYKATVGSKVTGVTILCETSDRGASVSIAVSSSSYSPMRHRIIFSYSCCCSGVQSLRSSVISVLGHFGTSTSVLGHFGPQSVRSADTSALGHFGPLHVHFVYKTFKYIRIQL